MKLLVILTTCTFCLDLINAKSNAAANQEVKIKGSTKFNSVSTTPKPESQISALQQQEIYRPQQYPQQPLPPQYQYQSQPQRQVHGLAQQVFIQPTQIHQTPQAHLHQQQLQQAAYQAQLQAQLQPQFQQVIQKAYIVPQQQNRPTAMILIAQPAYVPQNVVYGGASQQVLNYVQSNPQARYQFLQGNNQGQPQQIVQQSPLHPVGNYQVVAVPAQYQQNVVAVPAPIAQPSHISQAVPAVVSGQESPPQSQPTPLQLAQIAHVAAQQYSRINPAFAQQQAVQQQQQQQAVQQQQQVVQQQQHQQQQAASSNPYAYQTESRALQEHLQASPIRSVPPIITGFENFTPEQQEKIKTQLSAYFGAPLRPLPSGNVLQQSEDQGRGGTQYTQKYQSQETRLNNNEFVPSEQVKEDASASSSNVFKSHYARN